MLDASDISLGAPSRVDGVLERVRALGPTLRDRALQAEHDRQISRETIRDLDEAGVYKIGTPAESGSS